MDFTHPDGREGEQLEDSESIIAPINICGMKVFID